MGKKKRQNVIDRILVDSSADNTYSGLENLIYGKQKDVLNKKPQGEKRDDVPAAQAWPGNTAEMSGGLENRVAIDRQLLRNTGAGGQTRSFEKRARINRERTAGSGSALKKNEEEAVAVTREGITVQLRDSNGKLKVKVFSGRRRVISKEKLANIALDAILKELNKEG